jgi:hypothetical protein
MVDYNPKYFTQKAVGTMQRIFANDNEIVLQDFFSAEKLKTIGQNRPKWKHAYVPHSHSYDVASASFLPLDVLQAYLEHIVGPLQRTDAKLYRFTHRDYTILHDDKPKDVIELLITFTEAISDAGGLLVYRNELGDASVITPRNNQIAIVRTGARKRFVQYLNHHIGNKNLTFALITFQRKSR